MGVTYQRKQNEVVTTWWLHIQREYNQVFQVMQAYPKGLNTAQAVRANQVLRTTYTKLIMETCPDDCYPISKSLMSMMLNLIKSVEAMSERRILESRIHYDGANVDFTELQFNLLKNGIFQPTLESEHVS